MEATKAENQFDYSFADGDNQIAKTYGRGLVVRATLVPDPHETPDLEVYSAADIAAWERDEWRFWDMQIEVLIGGHCISRATVLGGIDCVDDQFRNDAHLDEIANECLRQIDLVGVVSNYAAEVAAAAKAAKGQ